MYAQLADEDIPFRIRASRVTKGDKPFSNISRADLKAKTNIQTRAAAYAVDELQMQKALMSFYQMIRQEPMFASNPEAVNSLLRSIGKAWSPQIKNKIDQILPTNQELQQKVLEASIQAVKQYVEVEVLKSESTGQEVTFNPKLLIETVQQYIKEVATPPSKEEVEAKENYVSNVIQGG